MICEAGVACKRFILGYDPYHCTLLISQWVILNYFNAEKTFIL